MGGWLPWPPPPSLITMHALCMQQQKRGEAKRTEPPKRTKDRPKIDQEKKPQNQKNKGRGWVRIRDIESPKIHTPPQPCLPCCLLSPLGNNRSIFFYRWRPLGGIIPYLEIAPLNGNAFHILILHFWKCIPNH